ncbi:MAG: sensor histidine kinase [Marinilabiliaceae bacterium]|nr:sensor histidine kinase [Marinilabiliaceae bacterium]
MVIQGALILSVLLQFGAFVITVSLIPKTKFNVAWISISAGFLLMAFRRFSDLLYILIEDDWSRFSIINSWIAVVISVSMMIASFYIRKIFQLLNRLDRIRKENESKVLRAIISTEESERRFFSKELHDGLGPVLSSVKMSLSALDVKKLDTENFEIIERTERAIDSAIVTTKEISNHLNPQVLERFGLEKALRVFVETINLSKQIEIKILSPLNNERLSYNIEIVLYRVICELINNTIKHANASEVDISLFRYSDKVECMYEDNGNGFQNKSKIIDGSGLMNIETRLKSVKGKMDVISSDSNGVFIKIEIPL